MTSPLDPSFAALGSDALGKNERVLDGFRADRPARLVQRQLTAKATERGQRPAAEDGGVV